MVSHKKEHSLTVEQIIKNLAEKVSRDFTKKELEEITGTSWPTTRLYTEEPEKYEHKIMSDYVGQLLAFTEK